MAKKNKSYWLNRQEQWLNTQDKDDDRITKRLEKEYHRTAKELEKDTSTYFNRYGQDNVIEFRTMLQDLSDADRKLLFQDMDRFAEKYPQYADLMPVRESIYQLNRLEGLHYSTQMKLLELGAIEQEELLKHLEKTYGKHYQNMLKELGIGNQFLAIDDVTMRNTLFTGWVNGENFSDRIWSNKERMLEHMQTVYRDGLARGDNYAKLTKAIRERFDVGASDAKRLVWTESTFVLNQAHTQAYRNAGVEEYEISAIRDSKTSPICRDMDGKVFRFDEMEVGLNFPPFHPYCRTTFIGLIDGIFNDKTSEDIKISSAEDARKQLVEKGGFLEVEDSFLSIDEDLQISNVKQLLKLEEKFGAVHRSSAVTIVGNSRDPDSLAYVNTFAVNPLQQNLNLSPRYFNSRADLIKTSKENIKTGYYMPAKMADEVLEIYQVTHEYGHMLQNVLVGDLMKERGWDPKKPMGMLDVTKKTQKAQMKFYTKTRTDVEKEHLKEIVEIAKEKDPEFSLFDHISDYGKSNESEFFAETFANSQLENPNALGSAMNIWLERKGLIKK